MWIMLNHFLVFFFLLTKFRFHVTSNLMTQLYVIPFKLRIDPLLLKRIAVETYSNHRTAIQCNFRYEN